MKELVIISGKGGTGKTSLSASFSRLAPNPVILDCDVDAPDLHILLKPKINDLFDFYGGKKAHINQDKCIGCGVCFKNCSFEAIDIRNMADGTAHYSINEYRCEGCSLCSFVCPYDAIEMREGISGKWMISETPNGMMIHAQLDVGAENSGKLVSQVKKGGRLVAQKKEAKVIITDGPPGIGCPVIAALSGANCALVVTEPTLSGEHDMTRAIKLSKSFGIKTLVCINKHDINNPMTRRIADKAKALGAEVVGRLKYDAVVTKLQSMGLTPVDTDSQLGQDIKKMWDYIWEKHLSE